MSAPPLLSRRRFLLLASLLSGAKAFAGDNGKWTGDNGIGGTGYRPGDNGIGGTGYRPGDNGIGGTGFVGVIRKFGSVYVNGQRIAYPDDAMIEIDGARVEARDMRIGQVARLVAERRGDGWTTSRIVIVSEVVGPVERVSGKRVEVLGQRVQLPNRKIARALRLGDRIAIGGLRRPDQTIIASAIERRESGLDQIAGVLSRGNDGATRIGALPVAGVGEAPGGQRIVVRGGLENGVFVARETRRDADIAIAGVKYVSIETWVSRRDGSLETAGGLPVEDRAGGLRPGSHLVIIDGEVGAEGHLIARKMDIANPNGGFDPSGVPGGGGPGGWNGAPGGQHGGALPGAVGGPWEGGHPGGGPGLPSGMGGPAGPGGVYPGGDGVPNWLGGGGAPAIGGGGPLGFGPPGVSPALGSVPPWGGGPSGFGGPGGLGGPPGGPRFR